MYLVLAACGALFGQRYAASDDGRVVYFSGMPSTRSVEPRLWAWEGDRIRTVMDGWSLEALSSDGQWALVRYDSKRHFAQTTRERRKRFIAMLSTAVKVTSR